MPVVFIRRAALPTLIALLLVGLAAEARAGAIIIDQLPGGPFTDGSGNTITVIENPLPDLAEDFPLALLKDVQANEAITAGFTLGALSGAGAGVVPWLEGITNNTDDAWTGLLLTVGAMQGGGAGFIVDGFAMTQPGAVVLGPELAPGIVGAALLSFAAPVLPTESFLFTFVVAYDVTGLGTLPRDTVAFALTEVPQTVPEPGLFVLLVGPAAVALRRRVRR